MEKMNETKVERHPYPKEKPKKNNKYLVSVKIKKRSSSDAFYWDELLGFGERLNEIVSAWAEMPEPYNPKENNNESR